VTKEMSDEEIAKRCGLKVSDVRSVLNKLHEYGITTYNRDRDKDTGWFSYNWTVNVIKLYDVLEEKKAKGAQREEEALAYEKSYTFYTCANPTCSGSAQRIPESEAVITTYSCNRCGESLKLFDNSSIIKSIEEKLASHSPSDQTFIKEFKQPAQQAPANKASSIKKIAKRAPAPKGRGLRMKANAPAKRKLMATPKSRKAATVKKGRNKKRR
jgi:transcription initiation factor TFIIE subunit alpha